MKTWLDRWYWGLGHICVAEGVAAVKSPGLSGPGVGLVALTLPRL